jgi:purine nucleoside phosphorylase
VSHTEAAAVDDRAAGLRPRVGVVLGSGLGAWPTPWRTRPSIDYADLPGFPSRPSRATAGARSSGGSARCPVAVLQGRAHVYEGGDLERIRVPVRALRAAGAEILVLTNAAGSLREEVGPGRLMLITDHST